MNQGNKNNENTQKIKEEIEEVVSEAQVSYHTLSAPTVGKKHEWKQRGNSIECHSCESPHGFRVKPGYQMCGIDERGMPVIKQIYNN